MTQQKQQDLAPVGPEGPDGAVKVANERPKFAPQRRTGGPMGGGPMGGGTGEKAVNFLPSLKRLVSHLAPERVRIILVILMGAVGVALTVYVPKLLGYATDVIFGGLIGRNLPAGMTKDQLVDALRLAASGGPGAAQVLGML